MKIEIKNCSTTIKDWEGPGYGLFINDELITAYMKGTEVEANVDTIFKTGSSNLAVSVKVNHELSVQGTVVVYNLYINKLPISTFAHDSSVYKSVMKVFKLKPPKK